MKKVSISLEALEPFFEKVGKLPQLHRILIAVVTLGLIIGGFVYLSIMPSYQKISELKEKLDQAEQQLTIMRQQASQIDKYRKEMAAAEKEFDIVKKKLPEEKDIPSLLEAISLSGQDAGLEFILFEPMSENKRDFYAEIPVKIEVEGSYHQLEEFLLRVAQMSRIVNVGNISMNPQKDGEKLHTSCQALTYRFVESAGQP